MLLGLGFLIWAGWDWFHTVKEAPATPVIQTMPLPPITGLEIPVRSSGPNPRKSTLKAAYAIQLNEKEVKVYGGFKYITPDKIIEGDEAIIDIEKGSARAMKNIRIWETKGPPAQ